LIVIISVNEVMFLSRFVCLSLLCTHVDCLDTLFSGCFLIRELLIISEFVCMTNQVQ